MTGLAREAVTVRMDAEKRAALDTLARALKRDRSFLINEAVDDYLAVQRWQIAEIEKGLREADAGDFASDAEVEAAFAPRR